MQTRSPGFLAKDVIDHDSEQFDYIRELHAYLWRFVHAKNPEASGDLNQVLDAAIADTEAKENFGLGLTIKRFEAVAASLDSACVELELILANPAISPERRESAMIALADAQACLLRCGVRTTPSAVTHATTFQPTL